MDEKKLIKFLKENLRLEVDFSKYSYMGDNLLKISIIIGDEKITEQEVTIDPTTEKGY